MTRVLTCFLLLLPLVSTFGQQINGYVFDEEYGDPIPGASIFFTEQENSGTVTDIDGFFTIQTNQLPCNLKVSSVGFITNYSTINSVSDTVKIFLTIDTTAYFDEQARIDRKYKAGIDFGYTGDPRYAPLGLQMNYSIQSLGKTSIEANINANYFTDNDSHWGTDIGLGKYIGESKWFVPVFIQANYFQLDYAKDSIDLTRINLNFSQRLGRTDFLLDYGISNIKTDSKEGNAFVLGATWDAYPFGMLGSTIGRLGINANHTFSKEFSQINAGAYKSINIGKFYSNLTFKYTRFNEQDIYRIGLVFNVHNTRYYCCASWAAFFHRMNLME